LYLKASFSSKLNRRGGCTVLLRHVELPTRQFSILPGAAAWRDTFSEIAFRKKIVWCLTFVAARSLEAGGV
jgi:hypothetical protein